MDLTFELRSEQVAPTCRQIELACGHQLGVVTIAKRSQIDADRSKSRQLGLRTRPALQVFEIGRPIDLRQPIIGCLKMGVSRAAIPDVAARGSLLPLKTRIDFASALARHIDGDAGLLLEGR